MISGTDRETVDRLRAEAIAATLDRRTRYQSSRPKPGTSARHRDTDKPDREVDELVQRFTEHRELNERQAI